MALTLTVLQTDVRLELGNPPTAVFTDDQIKDRINHSYYEIATRFRHPEMIQVTTGTLTASDATYALPTRYWYSLSFRDETNDQTLVYRPLSWIKAQDIDATGQPMFYTRRGSEVILYPTPAGAYSYTWYYVARPALLSAGGDTTTFDGQEWDEIVKWGAVWRCFQTLGQQDRMIHTRNIWRTLINSMPETLTLEAESASQPIGPLRGNPSPGSFQSNMNL